MENLLGNKRILLTGAAGLLGSCLLAELLKCGAEVIATDLRKEDIEERLKKMAVSYPNESFSLQTMNMTDESEVKQLFSEIGRLDGAVNCSYPKNSSYGKKFFDVSFDNFNENLALHLGSAFLFTQQCALYFKRMERPFSLVNLSSIYGAISPKFSVYKDTGMTMPVEYAAIKSAILHISKYAASYVNDSKFRVNCVSPGGILNKQPKSFVDAYTGYTNGKGLLDVKDVTGSIIFLLSDLSTYVTGENLVIDDGFSL